MKQPNTTAGLAKKRSLLAGEIEYHQKLADKLRSDFDSVGRAIKVLDPEFRLERIAPRRFTVRNRFFKTGECSRAVLEVLRDSQWNYTTYEVACKLCETHDLDLREDQFKAFTATVRTSLNGLKARNIVKLTSSVHRPRWAVR